MGPINVALQKVPFTANDCLDIETDLGLPVPMDYFDRAPFEFNGRINLFLNLLPDEL